MTKKEKKPCYEVEWFGDVRLAGGVDVMKTLDFCTFLSVSNVVQ